MNRFPSESDEDAYLFVDHRDHEEFLVSAVAERISEELVAEFDDEEMYVVYAGERHKIPLQISPHDRYIAISSLAMLLRERYQFFLLEPTLGDDTHGLFVAPVADVAAWGKIPEHLMALDIGYDYFHEIRVPYLGGEDSAPNFAFDREQAQSNSNAMGEFLGALLSGKMDEATAAKLAEMVKSNPKLNASAGGMSQAEVSAELLSAFQGAMASPEVKQKRQEMDEALSSLRALGHPQPKPWWKFW